MTTTKRRRIVRSITAPGPPIPVPPEPQPDPGGPVPPLPEPPDPGPDPDRASELLRLAELPRGAIEDALTSSVSASIVSGFVRMTRPRPRAA